MSRDNKPVSDQPSPALVSEGFAAVIGDLVASRRQERTSLHGVVVEALEAADRDVDAIQPLTPTLGDEFQGIYPDLAGALRACLLVRLHLKGRVDVRFGVGWGMILQLEPDREALGQDGPAWWSAREAIEELRESTRARGAPRGRATLFRVAGEREDAPPPTGDAEFRGHRPLVLAPAVEPLVNALLVCRDELVAAMDERDARILLGLFEGLTPSAIAEKEGISQPAVSQRAARSGAYAVMAAERLVAEAVRGEV